MKILLIYPNTQISCDGFRLISALLRKDGHQIQIVTIPKHHTLEISENELQLLGEQSIESDMVMIGVYSVHENHARCLTKYLKKLRPERLVIWGGPHCIGSPDKSLEYADGLCYSEGDIAIPQFVKLFESGDSSYLETPSMAFRVNGSVQQNPAMPMVQDLDSLPFYDYSFENEWVLDDKLIPVTAEIFAKYSPRHPFHEPTIAILTSRGCPYYCSFCNNIRFIKMYSKVKVRRQSVGRVIAELEYTLRQLPNARYICFSDDDFFARPEREILELVSLYKKHIGLPCLITMTANTFTKSKFSHLLDMDHVVIQMGVQTGSQRVLDEVFDRPISLKKINKVLTEIAPALEKGNIKLLCDFIVDNPYETKVDIIETYKFIARLHRKVYINIYSLSFFPFTPLYDRAIRDKFIVIDENFISRDFGSREIEYQINYPMFLLVLWEKLFFTRRLPLWVLMLPVSPLVRLLMSCVPRPIMAWAIQKIPAYTKKTMKKIISSNKRAKTRLEEVSITTV